MSSPDPVRAGLAAAPSRCAGACAYAARPAGCARCDQGPGGVELSRRAVLLGVLMAGTAQGHAFDLEVATDLTEATRRAHQRGLPLVVMVSLANCPFCRVARDHYLAPLVREGQIHVVQVDMRSSAPLRGLDSLQRSHDEQVRAWGVRVAPTLLFLTPNGHEGAPRLEGASVPDFYGAYLDERLLLVRPHWAR